MGNEMGNNNTSGLREEDNTAQDKSQQEVAYADDLKGQNHVVPATEDNDSQRKETGLVSGDVGREDPNSEDQKTDNKEEDDIKTEGKKSLQDAARTDDDKGQNHKVLASEDINVNEKETGLASINLEGVAELHHGNQKQDEKEQDYNMIPEAKVQEADYADEAKGQDHLVPAAEEKTTHGNETELISSEPDGIASSNVDNQKQDEKEKDNSRKTEEIPSQEAASTVETKAEAHLVPAAGDKNTHGIETGLVSSDHDGIAYPHVDNQKQDEKEEDININDEAKEKSSQAASTDVVERQDHLLPSVDDKNTHGNETWLVSCDPEGTDPHGVNTKQHEKEEDNIDAEPLPKDDHADDIEEKNLRNPAAEGEDCNNTEAEAGFGSSDPLVKGDTLDNQTIEGREEDINISDEAKEKSSQAASTDVVERQDHLLPPVDDKNTHGNETWLVSSDPEGTDPHGVNTKQHEKEEDIMDAEPQPKDDLADDIEEKNLTNPAVEGEDCNNTEAEAGLGSGDPLVEGDTLDNQTIEGREEDININDEAKEKSSQAAITGVVERQDHSLPAAEDKNTHGNETGLVSSDPEGTDPHGGKTKQHEKEEDIMNAEPQPKDDLADDIEEKNLTNPAVEGEDCNNTEAEAGLGSGDPLVEGDTLDNQTIEGREEDININDEAKEKSSQAAITDVVERQDHSLPAVEDKNTHGNETGLVSSDPEGTDPHGGKTKQHEKEEDNMDAEPLPKDDLADDIEEKNLTNPAAEDEDCNNTEAEAGLGSGDPPLDNQTIEGREEDININDEAKEKSSQAAITDVVERQDHSLPAVEDKNTHGNETGLVSSDPEGTDPHGGKTKQHEKEEDNMDAEPLPKDDHADDIEEKNLRNPAAEGEDCNNTEAEAGFGSSDPLVKGDTLDNQTIEGREEDINISDEAKEKSSQAASTDVVERQDHLLPPVDDKNTHGNETWLVSSDPEGTDPQSGNTKQHEKEEDNMDAEPLPKDDHADDIEKKNLTNPAAEGEDCNNTEAEAGLGSGDPLVEGDTLDNQTIEGREQGRTELHRPAESTKAEEKPSEAFDEGRVNQASSSSKNLEDHEMQKESSFKENLSGTSLHFENQNSMMKEDEGTRNSISDAASSTSHDSVPQEPAVLEPEEHDLAKIHAEQLVQVCNGPLKSEDMIIPSLTCQNQENGFILDSSISTDMVEFPDPSLEVEKERGDFLVKEMATKEVTSEEKFELKDGDEVGNHLGNITTIMTDFPNGVGAKCNGEFPSEMKSMKNDSPESQVEAYLSYETQNFLVEVSKTEEKAIVLSENATLVRKESENGNSKYFQIQSGEESIEKSNGQGSEEGSSADEQNASPPQFMMNGRQNEEKRCLLHTFCDSKSCNKDCQFEAKIIENGHLVDAFINYQNEATGEQQKDTQKVHLVTDPAVISADTFLTDKKYKEEDSEEKKMIEEMEDSIPFGNDTSRRENGGQCISRSYPIEQAEAFLSPSPFLHALTEKQQPDSHMECKKVQNSDESMAELKQESSDEFSTTEASSFVTQNLTEKNVVSVVELAGQKPLWDLSERPKPTALTIAETQPSLKQSSEQCAIGETPAIANGDYYQRESAGRISTESNPDNMSIHTQMRKSPSFDLDLRIDARAEESDKTPLLYQDKTTIESFSSQAVVTDPGKAVANTEYGKNSLQAMPVEEKVVTLERSDSDKSKTPFLGFLKEEEESDQILITPKKQDNQSAAKKATKVSAKEVTSASTKGKQKRKPRTSLFGTCMCCATVIN